MNWQHFQAFLWLRWRLRINQLKKGGTTNAILLALLAVCVAATAVGLFIAFFLLGLFALTDASPTVLMYVWDGLIVVFLFAWATGLMVELQRSEVLALDKFLHLPVSLTSAFLINYLSSLASVNMLLFVPATVGLSLALIFAKGLAMIGLLPLLAAFLLMISALTHQFQGWLAALMVNQRRRRTVLVMTTMAFVLLAQTPQLVNFLGPWGRHTRSVLRDQQGQELDELRHAKSSGAMTAEEFRQRSDEIQKKYRDSLEKANQQAEQMLRNMAEIGNLVLPPGWLALGAKGLAEGALLPALFGTLGLTLIGSVSLWRSYQTTLRLYTGQFTSGGKRAVAKTAVAKTGWPTVHLLERQLPGLSEHAAAVALTSFRSLLRAPEAKMILLTPVIMILVFGSLLFAHATEMPIPLRPLLAFGAMATVLLSLSQIIGNQFGFDRSGFRVYVLCAAERRDILLGKNLAVAPLPLGMGLALACLLQIVYPMPLDFFLALLPQFLAMYLIFCLLANMLSLLAPVAIPAGALRPPQVSGLMILYQFGYIFLFPLALTPMLLPLGIELGLDWLGWAYGLPICLLLSVIELVVVVYLYRLVLTWQGRLLQARELKILQIVTAKVE